MNESAGADPASRAQALTPAEALVLWKGVDVGPEALKATLVSLMAEDVVRMSEKRRGLFGERKRIFVRTTGKPAPPAPAFVGDIVTLIREVERKGGRLEQLIRALGRRYGKNFRRLTRQHVAAELERRGLASFRRVRLLGVPLWRRFRRTQAGDTEVKRIKADIARARRLPKLIHDDRMSAVAMAIAIGGLIYLLPELRVLFTQLGDAMRSHAPTSPQGDGAESGRPDLSLGFDPRLFHSLDAALANFGRGSAGADIDGDGEAIAGA